MSVIRSGDIRQLKIDGREYDPAPDSSCTVHAGGFSNEVARNGNGTLHSKQKRTLAGIRGLKLSLDDARSDLEDLQAVADSGVPVVVSLTLASGIAYSGSLVLVSEDLGKDSGEGTAEMDLLGERFEQI